MDCTTNYSLVNHRYLEEPKCHHHRALCRLWGPVPRPLVSDKQWQYFPLANELVLQPVATADGDDCAAADDYCLLTVTSAVH